MAELRVFLTAAALFVAMVLSGVIGLRKRVGAVLLALLSFVWLTVDHDFEGRILLTFSAHNGLTASDLVGVAGFVAAAILWWRARR
jgi:hypothetical protein